ncbi:hypothetical protein Tco_1007229, partial [Tanacetum coccineum]
MLQMSSIPGHFSKGPTYNDKARNYNLDKKTDKEGWRPSKRDYAMEKPK